MLALIVTKLLIVGSAGLGLAVVNAKIQENEDDLILHRISWQNYVYKKQAGIAAVFAIMIFGITMLSL